MVVDVIEATVDVVMVEVVGLSLVVLLHVLMLLVRPRDVGVIGGVGIIRQLGAIASTVVFGEKEQPISEVVSPITTTNSRNRYSGRMSHFEAMDAPYWTTGTCGCTATAIMKNSRLIRRREFLDDPVKVERDRLMRLSRAYSLFCSDLGNAPKIRVDALDDDNGDVYQMFFILARCCPFMVHSIKNAVPQTPSPMYYQQAFIEPVEPSFQVLTLNLQGAEKVEEMLNRLFSNMYQKNGTRLKLPYEWCGDPPTVYFSLYNTTWSARDLWDRFKYFICEFYIEEEPPITFMDPMVDLDATMGDSFSESMWAELPGFYTAYYANIGILLPVEFTVNQINATYWDQRSQSREVIVVQRVLNYGESTNIDAIDVSTSPIPFIGGLVDQLISAYVVDESKLTFWMVPRIRSFGRQTTKILSYLDYVTVARNAGFSLIGTPDVYKYYLSKDIWAACVFPILDAGYISDDLWPPEYIPPESLEGDPLISDSGDYYG